MPLQFDLHFKNNLVVFIARIISHSIEYVKVVHHKTRTEKSVDVGEKIRL